MCSTPSLRSFPNDATETVQFHTFFPVKVRRAESVSCAFFQDLQVFLGIYLSTLRYFCKSILFTILEVTSVAISEAEGTLQAKGYIYSIEVQHSCIYIF